LIGGFFLGRVVPYSLGDQRTGFPVPVLEGGPHFDILGEALGDDILSSRDGFLGAGHGQFGGFPRPDAGTPAPRRPPSLVLGKHDFARGPRPRSWATFLVFLLLFIGGPEIFSSERARLEDVVVEGFVQLAQGGMPFVISIRVFQVLVTFELVDRIRTCTSSGFRSLFAISAYERHGTALGARLLPPKPGRP
jgi:hypothetical protein